MNATVIEIWCGLEEGEVQRIWKEYFGDLHNTSSFDGIQRKANWLILD